MAGQAAGAGTPFTRAWLAMGVAQVVKEHVPDGGSASAFFSDARGRAEYSEQRALLPRLGFGRRSGVVPARLLRTFHSAGRA